MHHLPMGTNTTAEDLTKAGMAFETNYLYPDALKVIRVEFPNDKTETMLQFDDQHGKEKTVCTTDRFWRSLASKVGFADSIFNLFTHEEVWERIKQTRALTNKDTGNDRLRLVVDSRNNSALAMTPAEKAYINYEKYLALATEHGGHGFSYNDGKITSVHECPNTPAMQIDDEAFKPRIYVEAPIDGYGHPNVYLGMLREVCSNGMVAMASAFRTEVTASAHAKDVDQNPTMYTLDRMFETFSNDEGFDAISRRLATARSTPLSLAEASRFLRILQTHRAKFDWEEIKAFETLLGDFCHEYGLVDPRQLSTKQMAILPTHATVYDTINFFTEITTHNTRGTNRNDARFNQKVQQEVGRILANSSGFDLENTDDARYQGREYPAFYFDRNSN